MHELKLSTKTPTDDCRPVYDASGFYGIVTVLRDGFTLQGDPALLPELEAILGRDLNATSNISTRFGKMKISYCLPVSDDSINHIGIDIAFEGGHFHISQFSGAVSHRGDPAPSTFDEIVDAIRVSSRLRAG